MITAPQACHKRLFFCVVYRLSYSPSPELLGSASTSISSRHAFAFAFAFLHSVPSASPLLRLRLPRPIARCTSSLPACASSCQRYLIPKGDEDADRFHDRLSAENETQDYSSSVQSFQATEQHLHRRQWLVW